MALFAEVAALAEMLAETASRLKKRAAIEAGIVRVVEGGEGGGDPTHRDGATMNGAPGRLLDAGLFALYLAGQPFAENDPRKLNAGGALLSRAVLAVSGATEAALTAAYRRHGDLGAAAADLWPAEVSEGLTLGEVAEVFAGMAVARTTAVRAALVEALLRKASAVEAKYLLKLMLGDMRIGVKQSLVEEAIAFAAGADVAAVRHAVMLEADLARTVERAFAGTLGEARMTLFHCLGFMLASPVETPEEAVARFTEAPVKVPKIAKKGRKKKAEDFVDLGVVEGLSAVDAAAEGLVEDVEAEIAGATPMSQNRDVGHSVSVDVAQSNGGTKAGLSTALRSDRDDTVVVGVSEGGSESEEDAANAAISPLPLVGRDDSVTAPAVLAFLEDKYDGMRAQVHCGDASQPGRVVVYSRNREDITQSFPELEEAFAAVDEPLILDGEILGWDYGTGQALPFAVMGQRIGRKAVSNELRTRIPVVFMAFDLLFEGGELLLPLTLIERRAQLEAVVARWRERAVSPLVIDAAKRDPQQSLFVGEESPVDAKERLLLSPSRQVADAEAIDRAYRDARARANEGVMLKAANSVYLPGRRGLAWVKLKRELATLDVVITGAEFGHGKRAGLLSDYTFAVRGDGGELLNVGKAYSGVTDAEILELTEWLKAHTLEDRGHFRTVEPLMVLEVAFNNIMRSARHASGFAMRFPRILRVRTDKPVGEIDTLARVEEIYLSQVDRPVEGS